MRSVLALSMAGLRHRPWRAVLTALAVSLGAALMVALATVVVSLQRETAPMNAGSQAGADWVVGARNGPVPTALEREIGSLPEVAWVAPRTQASVLVDLRGEVDRALLFAIDPEAEAGAGLLRLEAGSLPGPGAPGVALRADAARAAGISLGDPVAFYTPDGRRIEWPLTGVTGKEGVGGAGGFLGLIVHRDLATQLGLTAEPKQLLVGLNERGPADWAQAQRDLLSQYGAAAWAPPPPYQGQTGGQVLLLIFSALGPVLSSFLIQNSFAISFRQRLHELALWRTLGATNRQVTGALLAEGALLGLAGGAAGLAAGVGLSRLILGYILGFTSIEATQSVTSVPVALPPWMALASLGISAAVTVISAVRPALSARRASAVAARFPAQMPDQPVTPRYTLIAGTVAVLTLIASLATTKLLLAAAHFAALMALLPALVQALARRFPLLPGPFGAAATLGGRRMGESSRRAVGGARSLMVAMGLLIGFGSISAAAWRVTAGSLEAVSADLLIQGGITPAVEAALAHTPSVAAVEVLSQFQAVVGRELMDAWATDSVEPGEVLVGSKLARQQLLTPGETMQVGDAAYRVAGTVPEDWDGPSTFYLSTADSPAHGTPVPVQARLTLSPGAQPAQVAADLRRALPDHKVQTAQDRLEAARQGHREKLGTFMAILYILAGFGALGVIQTSLLTVYEQLPELALLRAAGATVRQTALTVLVQAALPGLAGGVLGVAGGVLIGYHLVRLFSEWRGAALEAVGGAGWAVGPVIAMIALPLLSSLPAVLATARLSVRGALGSR